MDGIMFFAAILLVALVIIGCTPLVTAYLDGKTDTRRNSNDYAVRYSGLTMKLYKLGRKRG